MGCRYGDMMCGSDGLVSTLNGLVKDRLWVCSSLGKELTVSSMMYL